MEHEFYHQITSNLIVMSHVRVYVTFFFLSPFTATTLFYRQL